MKHRRTDPACIEHRAPRSPFALWRYERNRGKACPVCYPTGRDRWWTS